MCREGEKGRRGGEQGYIEERSVKEPCYRKEIYAGRERRGGVEGSMASMATQIECGPGQSDTLVTVH